MARALISELPALARQAGALDGQVDGLHELIDVTGVAVNDGFRQAVGCEDERPPAGFREPGKSLDDAARQLIQEAGHGVPRSRNAERRPRQVTAARAGQGTVVSAHDDLRVLGGEDDADHLLYSAPGQSHDGLLDPGVRVEHADRDDVATWTLGVQ